MWKIIVDSIQPMLNTVKTYGTAALLTAYCIRRGTADIQRLLAWTRGKIEPRVVGLWNKTINKGKTAVKKEKPHVILWRGRPATPEEILMIKEGTVSIYGHAMTDEEFAMHVNKEIQEGVAKTRRLKKAYVISAGKIRPCTVIEGKA